MSERTPLLQGTQKDVKDPSKLSATERRSIMGAIWVGVFLGALDGTIVATLLSSISSSFGASNQSSWLGTSYLLSTCCFTPLYGRLCDILGRRGANLTALCLFTIGTTGCAFAPSMNALIVARLIAGMGGGGMMTTSSIIASDLVPLKKRGFIQGCANLFFGAGAGLGGPLGGFISDTIGWRWAFIIQLPILCISFILVYTLVNYQVPSQSSNLREQIGRIDYLGSLTLVISIASLLISLSFKNNDNYPWSSPSVWGPLIIFAVFLILFVFVEAKISKEPVMPLRILCSRSPFCISVCNFLVCMSSFSLLYFYPMYYEAVRLTPSSEAGLRLLPNSIAGSIASLGGGYIIRSSGKYWWLNIISAALPVTAFISMSLMNDSTPDWLTWIQIIPCGLGFGSVITTTLVALIATVRKEDIAVATGLSYLYRYTGQVVGVAVSGGILQAILTSELRRRITGPNAEKIIDAIRHRSSTVPNLPPDLKAEAVASYAAGLKAVFVLNAGIAFIAFLICLPINEVPLPGSLEEQNKQTNDSPERRSEDSEQQ